MRGRAEVEFRLSAVRLYSARDPFTKVALATNQIASIVNLVLVPVALVTTLITGLLIVITFGAYLVILTAIWWGLAKLLLGTSAAWIRVPALRPVLFLPGITIALIADVFLTLNANPDGQDTKYMQLSLVEIWPLSWYFLKLPGEEYGKSTSEEPRPAIIREEL